MELLRYLNDHFFTCEQLLAAAGVDAATFADWQRCALMPQPSYRLALELRCDSFFGEHRASHQREYYAKGYVEWLHSLRTLDQAGAIGGLDAATLLRLGRAVALLDAASSPFAPHEVARSSRRRLVEQMRVRWRLPGRDAVVGRWPPLSVVNPPSRLDRYIYLTSIDFEQTFPSEMIAFAKKLLLLSLSGRWTRASGPADAYWSLRDGH